MVFDTRKGNHMRALDLPCGQCRGCRKMRADEWAVRIIHESMMHPQNCFVTLTYDDKHLPEDGSLDLDHFQRFMKRLRKATGRKMRYFHCGEYGDQRGRPHYHAAIFGESFRYDATPLPDPNLYASDTLSTAWGKGLVSIGSLTPASARYIAKYVTKKITGAPAKEAYRRVNILTGEEYQISPEYATMSRMPGLGRSYYERYGADVRRNGHCLIGNRKVPIPRYYEKLHERTDPESFEDYKEEKRLRAVQAVERTGPEMLNRERNLSALSKIRKNKL